MIYGLFIIVVTGCLFGITDAIEKRKQEMRGRIRAERQVVELLAACMGAEPYFACPKCANVTYSLTDIEQGFCPDCQRTTRKPFVMESV